MILENENEMIFSQIKDNLKDNYLPIPKHIKNEEITIFE